MGEDDLLFKIVLYYFLLDSGLEIGTICWLAPDNNGVEYCHNARPGYCTNDAWERAPKLLCTLGVGYLILLSADKGNN